MKKHYIVRNTENKYGPSIHILVDEDDSRLDDEHHETISKVWHIGFESTFHGKKVRVVSLENDARFRVVMSDFSAIKLKPEIYCD